MTVTAGRRNLACLTFCSSDMFPESVWFFEGLCLLDKLREVWLAGANYLCIYFFANPSLVKTSTPYFGVETTNQMAVSWCREGRRAHGSLNLGPALARKISKTLSPCLPARQTQVEGNIQVVQATSKAVRGKHFPNQEGVNGRAFEGFCFKAACFASSQLCSQQKARLTS